MLRRVARADSPYLVEKICPDCGRGFRRDTARCRACSAPSRSCVDCGRVFKADARRCQDCRSKPRTCALCGAGFTGIKTLCGPCQATGRECPKCRCTFRGRSRLCGGCRRTERDCESCGARFRSTKRKCDQCYEASLADEVRAASWAAKRNTRRAVKAAAAITGPLPSAVYVEIRRSGPCVYCAALAAHVDHVRPLSRGGAEHEDNLVPACQACNLSKGDRLLTNWSPERVAHGAISSPKVAAELARLLALADMPEMIDLIGLSEQVSVSARTRDAASIRPIIPSRPARLCNFCEA
jgi:5-methylcytosine-specific restriction endonuclease McrA